MTRLFGRALRRHHFVCECVCVCVCVYTCVCACVSVCVCVYACTILHDTIEATLDTFMCAHDQYMKCNNYSDYRHTRQSKSLSQEESRSPFRPKRGHTEDTPVDEQPDLAFIKPRREWSCHQAGPVGLVSILLCRQHFRVGTRCPIHANDQ